MKRSHFLKSLFVLPVVAEVLMKPKLLTPVTSNALRRVVYPVSGNASTKLMTYRPGVGKSEFMLLIEEQFDGTKPIIVYHGQED